ncbi:MAG: autotransporter domain-containing protein [Synergistaceae bacterium]|nr:autotransporter domain-containing protein [Synergistaceae bacterium]
MKKIFQKLTKIVVPVVFAYLTVFCSAAYCDDAVVSAIIAESSAIAQSKFSTVDLISDANNLLGGAGMENAMFAASESKGKFNPFFAANWTHSEMSPMGDVNIDSSNFVAGLAKRTSDRFLYGILFQAGRGRYKSTDTYSLPTGSCSITSQGDTAYMGGGLFLRYDSPKRWYTQFAAAAGKVWGDFASDDMITISGTNYAYDYDKGGYGLINLTIGKISPVKNGELNTYFKFMEELGVSAAFVVNDYDLHVAGQDLTRLRAGFRYSTKKKNALNGYFGLAYEYCFNSNKGIILSSEVWADTEDFRVPDISGGSGMAELGVTYKKQNSPWRLDLGLQGFAGSQNSISATLTAVREF